jgi:type IV secretion system protein VirD4
VVGAALLLAVVFARSLADQRTNKYTHGSARWAIDKDIRACGLLPRSKRRAEQGGVYVGVYRDPRGNRHYLRHAGPEHIFTVAPTRSGKTLGVFMTLLSHPESALVLDLKGELVQMTSGWRARHARNKILIFEPAHLDSARWNPLDEIDIDSPAAVGAAQNLTMAIVDPDGKGLQNHWSKTAAALLTGMILYVLHKARTGEASAASLAGIDAELSNPARDIQKLWTEMANLEAVCPAIAVAGKAMLEEELRVVAARNAQWAGKDMLDRPDEEGGSVLSTAKSFLALYRDPVVARNVSTSDFRIADLMNHDDPVTLYIVTQPADKLRLRPLVRLFMGTAIRSLAPRMEYATTPAAPRPWWDLRRQRPAIVRARAQHKHRLLMVLDEFAALGKMPEFQDALSWMAGYGIKAHILVQDMTQIKSDEIGYGRDEAITSNCHVQAAYPPNRIETAEYLSRMCGITTVLHEQVTRSGSGLTSRSRTIQEIQRPLLTADECLRLQGPLKDGGEDGNIVRAGDMLLYVAGYPAIYCQQPISVLEPAFQERLAIAPVRTDRLRVGVKL